MKMTKGAKSLLAWLLCTGCFLSWCHLTTSAEVGSWIGARWELLAAGGMVATTVAGMTRTKKEDSLIGGILGYLGQRFGGGKS